MMAGMLLGILTYRPIFNTFLKNSDVRMMELSERGGGRVKEGDPKTELQPIKNSTDTLLLQSTEIVLFNGISSWGCKPRGKVVIFSLISFLLAIPRPVNGRTSHVRMTKLPVKTKNAF